jgi:hypothetical protein
MYSRLPASAVLAVLILTCSGARAERPALTPEQLLAESKVIVIGTVLSHETNDEDYGNGAKTRWVVLRVTVESVLKSEAPSAPGISVGGGGGPKGAAAPPPGKSRPDPKPGESLDVRCWALIRPPSEGDVVSTGHRAIPGDGGRAKFFLTGQLPGGVWLAIVPNGVELLDQTPPLTFPTEPAPPPRGSEEHAEPARPTDLTDTWAIGLAAVAVLALVVGYLWFRWSHRDATGAATSPANPA